MTITEVDQETDQSTDLDSLDTSMDRVYAHRVYPKPNGVNTMEEVMTLPMVVALCGFSYKPTKRLPDDTPIACPKCVAIWHSL